MPPRLNKRQQRELEELEALGTAPHEERESSEDEEVKKPTTNAGTGFAALFTAEADEDEPESEEEGLAKPTKARKAKKKKKKAAPNEPAVDLFNSMTNSSTPSKKSKGQPKNDNVSLKKSKGKEKKSDQDDLDQALAELSVKYPDLQQVTSSAPQSVSSSTTSQSLASLLSVSVAHLDSEAEMRKFFGSKVISANKPSTSGPSSRSRQVGAQKSHLTRPQPSWWAAKQREGLSIQTYGIEDSEEKNIRSGWKDNGIEEKWWTVEYSKKYKSVTMSFMQAVMSGDPENLFHLLQKLPWHADTLLQLSEVYRHREDYSQAVDFVDRALFTYERSFIGAFNFTSGLNRLDFDRVENRPFFLAIHRQATDLQRRGCVRTAFEFARLLYSLDPWGDPHGALLHLDYLAVKCGMWQWLLDVWEFFEQWWTKDKQKNRVNVTFLPGWAYARALSLRAQEDAKKDKVHEASDAALKDAIQTFPEVVPLLADKADVTLPGEIRGHRVFQIITEGSLSSPSHNFLHLLSHLYAQRSFSLWKEPKRALWFANTVKEVFPVAKWSQPRRDHFLEFYKPILQRHATYRHIMILESSYRRLFAFIPREVLNAKQLACDPLPPLTTVNQYDAEFFKGAEDIFAIRARTRRDAAGDQRMLERLIPDPVFRRQLQDVFNAHPAFAERFPGGIVQFAQMAGQLPEDALDDIMIAAAMGDEGRNPNVPGAMPGAMPGEQELMFADFTDEEDEGGDNAPAGGNMPAPNPNNAVPREVAQPHSDGSGDDGGDDSEDDEYVAPMPVRVIRNIMNRFWGGNGSAAANEDTSEEEEEVGRHPVDNNGVD